MILFHIAGCLFSLFVFTWCVLFIFLSPAACSQRRWTEGRCRGQSTSPCECGAGPCQRRVRLQPNARYVARGSMEAQGLGCCEFWLRHFVSWLFQTADEAREVLERSAMSIWKSVGHRRGKPPTFSCVYSCYNCTSLMRCTCAIGSLTSAMEMMTLNNVQAG